MVTRREGASPTKLLFFFLEFRGSQNQREKSHHKNVEMRNREINARPCTCNPTVLDTWKSDRRAIVSLHDYCSVTIQLAELNHDSWMVGDSVAEAFFP
jgi:hypothetical protein